MTTFLFLRITLAPAFYGSAVTRGEPRDPFFKSSSAPVPVPPACAGLPDRDTD
jgi:hypothetical protein